MIFKIIVLIMLGTTIGFSINHIFNRKVNKSNEDIIGNLIEIVKIYETYEEELESIIDYYKSGMYETLEQNIELKRRLNNGNPRTI